jgi:hypothetical protein
LHDQESVPYPSLLVLPVKVFLLIEFAPWQRPVQNADTIVVDLIGGDEVVHARARIVEFLAQPVELNPALCGVALDGVVIATDVDVVIGIGTGENPAAATLGLMVTESAIRIESPCRSRVR